MPLRPHLPEGWYLIYWRAISVDGHPVQGAFTYAVGPNPGPAPQFQVPNISATATTPQLLIARWLMFVAVMAAIGLFVLRVLILRPVARRVPGCASAGGVGGVRGRLGPRAGGDSRVPGLRHRQRLVALGVRRRRVGAAVRRDRVRPGDPRLGGLLRAVLRGRAGCRCGSTGPSASIARSPSWPRPSGRCWRPPRC